MKSMKQVLHALGEPYCIKNIDGGDVIYRCLDTGYEFEVSFRYAESCILYVWSLDPRVLVGIYENIPLVHLKDVLGHYACVYQKLLDHIQVERQDIEE